MDQDCSITALKPKWSCASILSRLVIHNSVMPYVELSKLIPTLPILDNLTIDSCFPSDHVNHKAVFCIPNDRHFRQFDVEPVEWAFDGEPPTITYLKIQRGGMTPC